MTIKRVHALLIVICKLANWVHDVWCTYIKDVVLVSMCNVHNGNCDSVTKRMQVVAKKTCMQAVNEKLL